MESDRLADALISGHLAGAGIDVYDGEPPLDPSYRLLSAPNTVFTPHVGYLTQEAMVRRANIEFDNVVNYLNGTPKNVCCL